MKNHCLFICLQDHTYFKGSLCCTFGALEEPITVWSHPHCNLHRDVIAIGSVVTLLATMQIARDENRMGVSEPPIACQAIFIIACWFT